jgi:subtilisin family serine protease
LAEARARVSLAVMAELLWITVKVEGEFDLAMKRFTSSLVLALCFAALTVSAGAQEKVKITRADELPRRTIQLQGKALDILNDEAQLGRLADEGIKNLLADLAKYDIQDSSTLKSYYSTLSQLYVFKGDYDNALKYVPLLRELENKPAAKLTTGMFLEVYGQTRRQVADESSAEFKKAFEKNLAAAYAKLPYAVIAETVESNKGQLTLQNKEVMLGGIESQLQPLLDNTKGNVPEGVALQLVSLRNALKNQFPLKEERLRVLNALYEANNKSVKRENIWAARDVDYTAKDKLTPVVVGVWDSGTDIAALPAENRYVNPREQLNGKDDDGNGYIDDVSGIGYDLVKYEKSVGTLSDPAGKIKSDTKKLQRLVKGSLDLQSAINSPEALELQQTVASLKREQVKDFQEELSFYGLYSHGTHVAGIVAAGNPAAKVVAARMGWDYRTMPQIPTLEKSKFTAQAYRDVVAYFKKQNVRVVNMSWRYNSSTIEGALAANGVGKDAAERKKLANEMYEIERQGLYEAIKGAPEILFVCGSGNENNDANFSEYIPASFDLPNLITAGAVDSEGKKTSFTTEGKSVDFYANGYEVESYVPGGDRLKFSGTSMASPNVANLAAKLFAANPKLTPAEVVKLIAEGAEPSAEDPKIKLINPKRSLALLKK